MISSNCGNLRELGLWVRVLGFKVSLDWSDMYLGLNSVHVMSVECGSIVDKLMRNSRVNCDQEFHLLRLVLVSIFVLVASFGC